MSHCEHCIPTCCGEDPDGGFPFPHLGGIGSAWLGRNCPACAERERIVAWLREQRGWVTMVMSDGYLSTSALEPSDFADDIERGAHMAEELRDQ